MHFKTVLFIVSVALCGLPPHSHAEETNLRIESLVGWGHLDARGAVPTSTGDQYELDGIGGGGINAGVAAWIDYKTNMSFGLEYAYSTHRISGAMDSGGTKADGYAEFQSHAILLNALWRKQTSDVHPFIGVGVGASRMELDARWTSSQFGEIVVAPIGQLMTGFDYDLSDNLYWGVEARYVYVPVELVDTNLRLRDMAISAKVGIRF